MRLIQKVYKYCSSVHPILFIKTVNSADMLVLRKYNSGKWNFTKGNIYQKVKLISLLNSSLRKHCSKKVTDFIYSYKTVTHFILCSISDAEWRSNPQ